MLSQETNRGIALIIRVNQSAKAPAPVPGIQVNKCAKVAIL